MDVDPADDPSVHRLEASAPTTGGLVIKSKSTATFKVPKPSLLGLDRLAAQKRKEREDAKRLISFKDSEYDDTSGSGDGTPKRTPDESSQHKLNRQYREPQVETPTHSGGVSDKARDRLAERSGKERRGIAYSSKDDKRSRREDEESGYNRRDRRDRRDRHHSRDRRDRDRSDRSDRRRGSDSERSLHTPRGRDEPRTPRSSSGRSTTSASSWDDDDERTSSSKRSAWDMPTPRRDDKNWTDWSPRSSSKYKASKYADDTPRPTPAHKYNAWANDRKRSGATPHVGMYY